MYDLLAPEEAEKFADRGVVAESCALLLDAEGNHVEGLADRRIGVSEETLRGIDHVVAIAAVRSVLESGLVSSLIIDAGTAAGLVR